MCIYFEDEIIQIQANKRSKKRIIKSESSCVKGIQAGGQRSQTPNGKHSGSLFRDSAEWLAFGK